MNEEYKGVRVATVGLMRHKQARKPRKQPRKKEILYGKTPATCCVCDSDQTHVLGRIGRTEYHKCRNCGHLTERGI